MCVCFCCSLLVFECMYFGVYLCVSVCVLEFCGCLSACVGVYSFLSAYVVVYWFENVFVWSVLVCEWGCWSL